jgi:hypothetical protein
MTNRHHPEPWRDLPPTDKQLRYLRTLAVRKRQTFAPPLSRGEASDRISELKKASVLRLDRYLDDRAVSHGLATRDDTPATTGYGATARWA